MCSPVEIGENWTDEQCVHFLVERKSEDPLPCNVVDDVNPFNVEPWGVPESRWFLCKNERAGNIAAGYWKEMESDKCVYSGTASKGRKVIWEFYMGVAPSVDKTGWTMLEYRLENGVLCETESQQGFNSLCNVYWSNVDLQFPEGDQSNVGVDDAESDFLQLVLLNMLKDERNSPLQEPAQGCQGGHQDEQLLLVPRGKPIRQPYGSNLQVSCEFSREDFLELNDFEELDSSSSSSSDNSSHLSGSDGDYFDSEALLRSLEDESDQNRELQRDGCNIQGSPGSILHNETDGSVECVSSSSGFGGQVERKPGPSSSTSALASDECTSSKVGKRDDTRAKRAASRSPQGSGNSQASTSRPGSRIMKFGKKYCCLRSF